MKREKFVVNTVSHNQLQSWKRKAQLKASQYEHAVQSVEDETTALNAAKTHLQDVTEAQKIVQHIAQEVQKEAHHKIAAVVTKCLSAIFGDSAYGFKIEFDRKRGRTEARLAFVRNGYEIDPTSASGGGAIDVSSFALRLAALVLSQPKRRRLLVIDEGFKHLSRQYRPQVRSLLESLSKEMKVQLLVITHAEELVTGKVIEL